MRLLYAVLLAPVAAYTPTDQLLKWKRVALATKIKTSRTVSIPASVVREVKDWRSPTRYASPSDFGKAAEEGIRKLPETLRDLANPYGVHSHIAITLCGFAAYPALVSALQQLPPPNASEGGFFFSLMSIVFGTLTASTISDAGDRLKALRASAVDEATLLLTLTTRLEGLRGAVAAAGLPNPQAVYEACAASAWAHTSDLIDGTRCEELDAIAAGSDEVTAMLETLVAAQAAWENGSGPNASPHLDAAERLIAARGARLSLESASIPRKQYDVLHALSMVLVLAYAYLTLDPATPTHALGAYLQEASGGVSFDDSIGVRVLFSFIVGALGVFNRLAKDAGDLKGDKLESETVAATLKKVRFGLAPALGRNHIALTPRSKRSARGGKPPPVKFFA